MNYKQNCLSNWLPKLVELGIPTPSTIVADMNKVDKNLVPAMRKIFWMKEPNKEDKIAFTKFRSVLESMGHKIGYPLFLRTGQTSHKHEWQNTCFVESQNLLMKNVQNLAEHSIMADYKSGFPINIWVVRKMLEVKPAFTAFGGMPIVREFRYFIKNGKILCRHPYWPDWAFKNMVKDKNWKSKLEKMNKLSSNEQITLDSMAKKIAEKFKGFWSIDFFQDSKFRWCVIDMATGKDSYHWKGCKYGKG